MVATKFEPHDNWLPPGFHVSQQFEQALIDSGVPQSHWNTADLPDPSQFDCGQLSQMIKDRNKQQCTGNTTQTVASERKSLENLPSFVPYNLLTQHSIPDKSIADCVEGNIILYYNGLLKQLVVWAIYLMK